MDKIYTITVFQTLKPTSESNLIDFGSRRCVGWYKSKDEAANAVENNFSDMHDYIYNYAIIEEMDMGVKLPDISRSLYKWDNTCYKQVEIPKSLYRYSNFGIG